MLILFVEALLQTLEVAVASGKIVFGCEHSNHNETCERSVWEDKPFESRFLGICNCICHKKDLRKAFVSALSCFKRVPIDEDLLHERFTI
jgi:hypothetical protein